MDWVFDRDWTTVELLGSGRGGGATDSDPRGVQHRTFTRPVGLVLAVVTPHTLARAVSVCLAPRAPALAFPCLVARAFAVETHRSVGKLPLVFEGPLLFMLQRVKVVVRIVQQRHFFLLDFGLIEFVHLADKVHVLAEFAKGTLLLFAVRIRALGAEFARLQIGTRFGLVHVALAMVVALLFTYPARAVRFERVAPRGGHDVVVTTLITPTALDLVSPFARGVAEPAIVTEPTGDDLVTIALCLEMRSFATRGTHHQLGSHDNLQAAASKRTRDEKSCV